MSQSLMQTLADRIADHMDDHQIYTADQQREIMMVGISEGARLAMKYRQEYLVRRFAGQTPEDLVEVLIETVKEYTRNQAERDF